MKMLTNAALVATLLFTLGAGTAQAHDRERNNDNYNHQKTYTHSYQNRNWYEWNNHSARYATPYNYSNRYQNTMIRVGYSLPRSVEVRPVSYSMRRYLRTPPRGYEYVQAGSKIILRHSRTNVVKDIINISFR